MLIRTLFFYSFLRYLAVICKSDKNTVAIYLFIYFISKYKILSDIVTELQKKKE